MKRLTLWICLLLLTAGASAQSLPRVGDKGANDFIVRIAQQGWKVEGASLSYDGRTLYLSSKKSGREVCDLYVCHMVKGKWQMPQLISELSTETDEWSPTISSDEQTIYFIRRDVLGAGTRKEKSGNMLYCSTRQPDGHWAEPEWMLISNGQDSKPEIYPDNRLLTFYSLGREEEKQKDEKPRRYYVRKLDKYNWTLPQLTVGDPASMQDTVTTLEGRVVNHKTNKPMQALTEVYDALTQKLIAAHETDEEGRFRIALPSKRRYRVEVSQTGFSKAYIRPTLNGKTITEEVRLTPELTLNIRVFDLEQLSPLSYRMAVTDSETGRKTMVDADKRRQPLQLMIGKEYVLALTRQGYADTTYMFDTRRDVLVAETDVDLYMRSGHVKTTLAAIDEETGERVEAQLTMCPYETEQGDLGEMVEVKGDTLLQCYQLYHLSAMAAGYLFKDTLFYTIRDEGQQLVSLALSPLKKEAVIQLNNIEFEYNSYLLREESYEELQNVAELMRRNPGMHIELSAHTDDIGSADYNLRLSQKRGESAARYLIEQGIEEERIVAKGYGKTRPLVPNDSAENRAINRRVEFTILDL